MGRFPRHLRDRSLFKSGGGLPKTRKHNNNFMKSLFFNTPHHLLSVLSLFFRTKVIKTPSQGKLYGVLSNKGPSKQ